MKDNDTVGETHESLQLPFSNQMFIPVQLSQRWNALIPLFSFLFISLVFLSAASTVILSLISLYLPTRNINPVTTISSSPQQATFALPLNSNLPVGSSLNAAKETSLQNQMQTAISTNSNTKDYATVQVSNAVGGSSSKRKRRQTGSIANILIVTYKLLFNRLCFSKRCQARVIASARIIFSTLQINITDQSVSSDDQITGDIALISQYWALLRPYKDNPENFFGVSDVGLPSGCQVEQAHLLHRHGARYPSSSDISRIRSFAQKVQGGAGGFTGVLSFLNTWSFQLGQDLLTAKGADMAFAAGATFWTRYGRLLYNAKPGQNTYNATGQTPPVLRCNSLARIYDSARKWADGFFGFYNQTSDYTLLVLPIVSGQNNTLASYISCPNENNNSFGLFDSANALYYPISYYLQNATARLSAYFPSHLTMTVQDAFSMQSLCAYEYTALGSSDFCSLFTLNEWQGFQYTYDLYLYNGASFGQPAGRALGVGYLQELLARLKNQYITTSDSSVNSTLDSSPNTFPLNQPFYLDMTHDTMMVATFAAMSLDYFHQNLSLTSFPPPADRHFQSSYIVPYAARLITEKIGCVASNPTSTNVTRTQYTSTQYGYSPTAANYKFVRMRLNNGILPLNTIRGGLCAAAGRTDGLCPLASFIASQANISAQSNFAKICYGKYTFNSSAFSGDGNYFPNI